MGSSYMPLSSAPWTSHLHCGLGGGAWGALHSFSNPRWRHWLLSHSDSSKTVSKRMTVREEIYLGWVLFSVCIFSRSLCAYGLSCWRPHPFLLCIIFVWGSSNMVITVQGRPNCFNITVLSQPPLQCEITWLAEQSPEHNPFWVELDWGLWGRHYRHHQWAASLMLLLLSRSNSLQPGSEFWGKAFPEYISAERNSAVNYGRKV